MDIIPLIAFFGVYGFIAGSLGAVAGAWLALRTFGQITQRVLIEAEAKPITARVTAPAAVTVPVKITIPAIEPLNVPIVMAPAPSAQELAEKILAAGLDAGPTALATITGMSKSTAHALIHRWRNQTGTPNDNHAELDAWPPNPTSQS